MTVSTGGGAVVLVAAAGTHAEEVEELQLLLGEGPCVDAVRFRRPVGRTGAREPVVGLADSVTPPELYQAQGMVMIQVGLRPTDALARIRAYAFAHGRRLGDVARDITTRRIRFTPDQT